jgi:hypothetical protein
LRLDEPPELRSPLLRFEDEPESESESPPLLRELPESESEPPLCFFDEPESESLSLSPPDFFLDEPESESLSFLRLEPESELPPLRLRELPPESESPPPLLRDEPESESLSLLLLLLRSVSSSAMRSPFVRAGSVRIQLSEVGAWAGDSR